MEGKEMNNSYYDNMYNRPFIVYSATGDVTGDGIPDNVYLTGIRTPDSPFVQQITLMIQDGSTGRFNNVPLKSNAGYNPTLFLGDFTGDGVKDILISIATGGSGGTYYYYIYSNLMNVPKLLFDYEAFNQAYQYSVNYMDYFRVEVISEKSNKRFIIDISDRGQDYLNEIYDENGMLKEPIEGWVDPVSGLYPIDFDTNGVYELMAFQQISGRFHADSLGYVQTTLRWDQNQFSLMNQYVSIFGADI